MAEQLNNIKRFAVVHRQHGAIMIVAPDEDFCKKYCGRENMERGYDAYYVAPHDEKILSPKPPAFSNGINILPEDLKKEPIKPIDVKSRVADYLKKTLDN